MPELGQGVAEPKVFVMLRPWAGSATKRNGEPYQSVPGGLQLLHDTTLFLVEKRRPLKVDPGVGTYENNVRYAGRLVIHVESWTGWSPDLAPSFVGDAVFMAKPGDKEHYIIGGRELTEESRERAGTVPCVLVGGLLQKVGILYPGQEVTWLDTTMDPGDEVASRVFAKPDEQFQTFA